MKYLYLSSENNKLCGVCGGLGEYLNIDPTLVRLLWVIIMLVTAVLPMVIAYVVAWLIIPERRHDRYSAPESKYDTTHHPMS
jgi:phage shock protein C